MQQKAERFHFLDGLRGIAAMLIVVHHTFTSNIYKFLTAHGLGMVGKLFSGFTQSGVELFFVLSGVVLLRPYLRYDRKLKIGDYYYRRLKRIYPPYLGALIFGSLVIVLVHAYPTFYSDILMTFSWEQLFEQLFIFNFDGYYYNLAWWSLQIEILFYLIVPVVIYTKGKGNKGMSTSALWTSISIALVVMTALQLYYHNNHPTTYSYKNIVLNLYKSLDYPVCFILGVYLAGKDVSAREAGTFLSIGVGLIFASFAFLPLEYTGYGFVYAGTIAMLFNKQDMREFLSRPLFIWLGERSYSLFLTHFSVLYLTNYLVSHFTPGRTMAYGIATRTLGIPFSIFIAMLLFHFVEKRFAKGLITGNMFWPWQAKALKEELKANN